MVVHHPEGDVHLVLLLLDAAAAHHGRTDGPIDRSTDGSLLAAAAAGARRHSTHTQAVYVYISPAGCRDLEIRFDSRGRGRGLAAVPSKKEG